MKTCELVVCGEIYCTANSFCKNVLKGRHTSLGRKLHFYFLYAGDRASWYNSNN